MSVDTSAPARPGVVLGVLLAVLMLVAGGPAAAGPLIAGPDVPPPGPEYPPADGASQDGAGVLTLPSAAETTEPGATSTVSVAPSSAAGTTTADSLSSGDGGPTAGVAADPSRPPTASSTTATTAATATGATPGTATGTASAAPPIATDVSLSPDPAGDADPAGASTAATAPTAAEGQNPVVERQRTQAQRRVPLTGGDVVGLALTAVGLMAAGAGLLWTGRRQRGRYLA